MEKGKIKTPLSVGEEIKEAINKGYENKICIGLPHTGTFPWNTTMSLLGLKMPEGFKAVFHMVGSCLVYDARQQMVDYARQQNCKYVVMIDSDMVVPTDFLLKTIGLLEREEKVHVVTGTIFKRTPPFQPCFYSKVDYDMKTQKPRLESPVEFPKEGILPLAGLGLACCTIKTELFDIIDEKKSPNMNGYFFPLPNMGEDLTFSLIARKCGGGMVCDLSIDVGHVSAMPIHQDHYRSCYEEWKRKNDGSPIFGEGTVKK